MNLSNTQVAKLLREVAAAYQLKGGNLFQIRAYEGAADTIERLTTEVKDLWEAGQLDQIPGVGESLQTYLNELFTTGKVKHWTEIKKGIPGLVFELLDVPGIGPKTALKVSKTGVADLDDLRHWIKTGLLLKKGISEKLVDKIKLGLGQLEAVRTGRMLLPIAFIQSRKVLDYLIKNSSIKKADVLGSLRRMAATVGDLDFAVASDHPKDAVEHIINMPGISEVLEKGETQISLSLPSGVRLDFLIVSPKSYGALLQHFTGSKQHNIHLRTIAEKRGLSLSEYGVKDVKSGKVYPTPTEKEFYGLLGIDVPPPELREDTGEIEAALEHNLPKLVRLEDIKGDLHIHDNFEIEPSHDLGVSTIEGLLNKAKEFNYKYLGLSDHSPSISNHTPKQIIELIKDRNQWIEHKISSIKDIRVLKLLEVDILPDGSLSVPNEGLKILDFAIASVHSSFNQSREKMTERILNALANPFVKILGHPTGRMLTKREAYEADWERIFQFAAENNKALEINSFPDRLDLPDHLVRIAKSFKVKFVINTDTHELSSMENMKFGVAVARRGWATPDDIINSWDWTKFAGWFNIL